jgi:adenosylmethionine-8-amino-7-oxononanoate aminotransferase
MAAAAQPLSEHPHIGEVRQVGMVLAAEMVKDKQHLTPFPWQERRGLHIFRHALERGVLMRPLGHTVYWMPPYVISPDEVKLLGEVAAEGIDKATGIV